MMSSLAQQIREREEATHGEASDEQTEARKRYVGLLLRADKPRKADAAEFVNVADILGVDLETFERDCRIVKGLIEGSIPKSQSEPHWRAECARLAPIARLLGSKANNMAKCPERPAAIGPANQANAELHRAQSLLGQAKDAIDGIETQRKRFWFVQAVLDNKRKSQ